ncbi:MAG: DeoR/GlpR family DNA-binding transcription regulator [Atopobiaceae bacterium]|nr:DeoR/GlpR family DNA-binding transcription regulator [Atopobiaceae bacterium]MCI2174071.1 DeoR/GlpR family DNA-binding transcription regulator [Atopobiaceae bacterium]
MLATERLNNIVTWLGEDEGLTVSELAERLGVSVSTVQRDLRKLEGQGSILRARGGALPAGYHMTTALTEVETSSKEGVAATEKTAVAAAAATLVEDGECIFLDSGSTLGYLAPHVASRPISIVTNSLYLVKRLGDCRADVTLVGGTYDHRYDMCLGQMATDAISRLNFDAAFLSASGVDARSGKVMAIGSDLGMLKQLVMANAAKSHLLVDSSKFQQRAMDTFARLGDFDTVITDSWPEGKRPANLMLA